MAATLALPTHSSSTLVATLVPPPSQDFAMHQPVPDVFVIPPEEEQEENPPWCYFDAAAAAKESFCTSPDMDALDVALGLCQQTDNRAPSFHRHFSNESQETIVMPRKGTLLRLQDMDLDTEDGQTDIRSRNSGGGSDAVRSRDRHQRTFDEEIVEVVKVRRNEGMVDVEVGRTLKMKKSSTFRARATQALRSIKNVGRSNNRRASVSAPKLLATATASSAAVESAQAHAATLPSRHPCPEPSNPRPTSPTGNRRRSLTLSQMFAFKEKEKEKENQSSSRASSPFLVEPPSPPCEPAPLAHPTSPIDNTSSSHARRLQPSPSLEDCAATPTRSPSPSGNDPSKPTLSKRKSFRRRLSVLELQKLFSMGGSSNAHSNSASSAPDTEEDLFSPSRSRPVSMESTAILSNASSRTSGVSSLGDMSSRPSSSSQRTGSSAHTSGGAHADTDADLEMRLDSLHFDSLHFDPDEILSLL
ncbi:hypothetical protein BD414DRAFT_519939 [Trametes punicea]|nr:hypothetical protein BD414DRAFT_519939 [Trametes punicea]